MRINAPIVRIKIPNHQLFFVKDNSGVLHQVRDIAHLGEAKTEVVEAEVTEFPDAAINVPDENVRIKGARENG